MEFLLVKPEDELRLGFWSVSEPIDAAKAAVRHRELLTPGKLAKLLIFSVGRKGSSTSSKVGSAGSTLTEAGNILNRTFHQV